MPSYEVSLHVTVLVESAEDEDEATELAMEAVEFTVSEQVTGCHMTSIRETGE